MVKRHDPESARAEETRASLLVDVCERLRPLRPKAAAKLTKVTAKAALKGCHRLRFEMFDVSNEFSVSAYAESDSPGGKFIVSLFSHTGIPGMSDAEVDWGRYWAAGVDPWAVVQQAVCELVADAWADAGGSGYPLPAVICSHDDAREFDLVRRRWVTDHQGQPLAE